MKPFKCMPVSNQTWVLVDAYEAALARNLENCSASIDAWHAIESLWIGLTTPTSPPVPTG